MTIGTVNIAYTIDCNAVLPCYVSVKSMLAHTKTKVDVYIVSDSPLPNKDRATLETLRSENANIEFITIDGTLFNNFPIGGDLLLLITVFISPSVSLLIKSSMLMLIQCSLMTLHCCGK